MRGLGRWLPALLVAGIAAAANGTPWTFRADFSHGLNGWMSYPLPQDIGFDPSLWVDQGATGPMLIRQVESAGQSSLSAGFIRPLHFLADHRTRVRLRYVAAWPSTGATLRLLFAGENGRRYETTIPATGTHAINVSGAELGLAAAAVPIEAIVLMGHAAQPETRSTNRVELSEFQLDATRPAEIPLTIPALIADPDRAYVAAQPVDPAAGLSLEFGPGASPVRVVLKDGGGRTAVDTMLKARGRQTISLGVKPRPGLWTAHLENAREHTNFFFLVLGSVPAHPRVLLSASRLATLRTAPEFVSLRKQIHERAAAQTAKLADPAKANSEIAALPVGRTLHPSFDGELTSYFQLVESYSNAIALSALDYALTADRASLQSARRELLAMAHWSTWTPPRFAAHGMHTYYETGIVAQRLAFAYDLIAATLSSDEKREIAEAFRTKCIEPTVDEYYRYDRMPTAASNWMANSLGGALAAAIAVADDVPGWGQNQGGALAELIAAYEHNLRGLFPGDGSEMEPAGYEHFAMEGLSWGAAALRALNIKPEGTGNMLEAFWWPDYVMVRPNLVLDTGDFNGSFRTLDGFAFGAEYGGIPALRAFYNRVDTNGRAPDLLDLLCCSERPQPISDPVLSRVFDLRGSAVLRSGWGPDDTVISLRAGPWFNHEHHDQGSFQVAAFGNRLISEAGYANYYLDPNYPAYFTQATGHNTVLVDDDAFSQGDYDGRFWRALESHPVITDRLLSPQFDYLTADLAPAYKGRVSKYQRQYLFLAPDVLIVRDSLHAPQSHVFTWLLHAAEGAAVDTGESRARITAGDAEADVTAAEATAMWEVRPTPLPSSTPQYLGNVLLDLKHEDQARRRRVLRLSSTRSTDAHFEVAMQFRRREAGNAALQSIQSASATGFADGPSAVWALLRNGPGELQFRDLTSDGSVLAGRGKDWIAIDTREVRLAGQQLFTASDAADAVWTRSPAGIELGLELKKPSVVTLHIVGPIAAVSVDGSAVRYSEQNGSLVLPSLAKGGHSVRISIRAAI